MGPMPHSDPADESETRSFAERDLRESPTVVFLAHEQRCGEPDVVEEHLVERVRRRHVDDRLMVIPGRSIGQTK